MIRSYELDAKTSVLTPSLSRWLLQALQRRCSSRLDDANVPATDVRPRSKSNFSLFSCGEPFGVRRDRDLTALIPGGQKSVSTQRIRKMRSNRKRSIVAIPRSQLAVLRVSRPCVDGGTLWVRNTTVDARITLTSTIRPALQRYSRFTMRCWLRSSISNDGRSPRRHSRGAGTAASHGTGYRHRLIW